MPYIQQRAEAAAGDASGDEGSFWTNANGSAKLGPCIGKSNHALAKVPQCQVENLGYRLTPVKD